MNIHEAAKLLTDENCMWVRGDEGWVVCSYEGRRIGLLFVANRDTWQRQHFYPCLADLIEDKWTVGPRPEWMR